MTDIDESEMKKQINMAQAHILGSSSILQFFTSVDIDTLFDPILYIHSSISIFQLNWHYGTVTLPPPPQMVSPKRRHLRIQSST